MKISRATALSAMAGTVPSDLEEYTQIGDFVAKDGPPFTLGRAGCFLALGKCLEEEGVPEGELVDISKWHSAIDVEEAMKLL